MGARLTIKRLEEMARHWYGSDIAAARDERDHFKAKMRRWFGREEADRITKAVQVAVDPEATGPMSYVCPVAQKAILWNWRCK
jgi:hypothetical protein